MTYIVATFEEHQLAAMFENSFEQAEREKMREANRRLTSLYKGGALDGWLLFHPRLTAIRAAALQASGANSVQDRRYQEAFRHFLKRLLPAFIDDEGHVRSQATHLLWLAEDGERLKILDRYRSKLTASQHVDLATPKAARNAV